MTPPKPELPDEQNCKPSVIYRTGELTEADYDEAIEALQLAKSQMKPDGNNCAICSDGHQAMHCHHNPLLKVRQLVQRLENQWLCFHCGAVFTDEESAREHFGENETVPAACTRPSPPSAPDDVEVLIDSIESVARDMRMIEKGEIQWEKDDAKIFASNIEHDVKQFRKSSTALSAQRHAISRPEGDAPPVLCHNVDFGTYKNAVGIQSPSGKLVTVDICMIPEIKWLWDQGIETIECCCGHGKADGYIATTESDRIKMDALGYAIDPNAPHCFLTKSKEKTDG